MQLPIQLFAFPENKPDGVRGAWRYKSQEGLFPGYVFVLWRGREKRAWNRRGKKRKKKKGMGKERRENIRREGWRGEQRGREERDWRGVRRRGKRLVRVWWFWGNSPPRRLLTQAIRLFCGVVQLCGVVFSLILRANNNVVLFRAKILRAYSSGGKRFLTSPLRKSSFSFNWV